MPDEPKTPSKRVITNRSAPVISTPGRIKIGTPKHADKISAPSGEMSRRGRVELALAGEKENSSPTSANVPLKPSVERKIAPPKTPGRSKCKQSPIDSRFLKVKTSREAAEVVALLRTAPSMKVIEVASTERLDENLFRQLMKQKVPVVFRGLASGWNCVKMWSRTGYLKRAATEEAENLPHRKYRQFVAQSAERGRLHLTDGKSKAKAVTLLDFLESTEKNRTSDGQYLLGIHAVGANSSLSYCPVQPHEDDEEIVPPLSKDVPQHVDVLEWYSKLLAEIQGETKPVKYDHQQFFLARGYAFTDLHYDSYDNFYVAVSGKRRWTLASPNASRWLISTSSGKLKSGSNAIPHLKEFTAGSPAQIFPFSYIDLLPGDVLYVPNCWWHLVESCPGEDGFSSAFNFFFSKPPEKVFGDFQATLAETEALVNSMQRECRENLASVPRGSSVKDKMELRNPPGILSPDLWETVLELGPIHHVGTLIDDLYKQHISNSLVPVNHAGTANLNESVVTECPKSTDHRTAKSQVPNRK